MLTVLVIRRTEVVLKKGFGVEYTVAKNTAVEQGRQLCESMMDPFQDTYGFIFCNKKRDSIKVLRYDKNGFLLSTKKLLDGMKFQWPRTPDEVKQISFQQVEWLLQGLKIEQEKEHHPVKRTLEKSCF